MQQVQRRSILLGDTYRLLDDAVRRFREVHAGHDILEALIVITANEKHLRCCLAYHLVASVPAPFDGSEDRADAADSTTEPSEREVETTLQLFFKAAV